MAILVYPVLIVHDTRMDAPAYGDFLATEFLSLLGDPGNLSKRVAPLTVITVADLENLQLSVGQFGFRQLLEAYTQACPDRLRSLHNFIAYSEFATKMMPSEYLGACQGSCRLNPVMISPIDDAAVLAG